MTGDQVRELKNDIAKIRRTPERYLGGTDEHTMLRMADRIVDNAIEEAGTGHANTIQVVLADDGSITIADNERGIPVSIHPLFGVSALLILCTTLPSKRLPTADNGYAGVGLCVVNALSEKMQIEVVRDGKIYRQSFTQGKPDTEVKEIGPAGNRRGTSVCFLPDPDIFGPDIYFKAADLQSMTKEKTLRSGFEIEFKKMPN